MKISPTIAIKLFICGALTTTLANMYLVMAMKRFAPAFRANSFAATNLRWIQRVPGLRALLGDHTIEYMRTRTVLFPFLELAGGAAVVLSASINGIGAFLVRDVTYILLTFSLGIICWKSGDPNAPIPNAGTHPGIAIGLIMACATSATPWRALTDGLIGAAAGYLLVRLCADAYYYSTGREGLGLGVGKLFAVVGAFYGWKVVPSAVLLASLLGIAFSTPSLVLARRRGQLEKGRRTEVPFGHFVAASGFLAGVLQPVFSPLLRHWLTR